MAFFLSKHSSAAAARLTEDPDVTRGLPPRPTASKPDRHAASSITIKPKDSPGKHRRLESTQWVECENDEDGDDTAKPSTTSTLITKSTSYSSTDDSDDDSDYSDVDDDGTSDGDISRCSSGDSAGHASKCLLQSVPCLGQCAGDEGHSVTSKTSATTNSSTHSLADMIGDYDDGDLQTLNQLVNKLHAVELERENHAKTPKIKNSRKKSPPIPPIDLPSEVPENPPHFSPLQSSHRLSISSVNSWKGQSLEVIPTEDVANIMPLWKSQWTLDRREWEKRKKTADDLTFKRSRTHNDELNSSIALQRRNNSLPSKIRRHNRVRHGAHLTQRSNSTSSEAPSAARSATSSTRNYRYGKPPTLPNAKNPNPMVRKSSKRINRKHARYALTAGMMLGIRESVGGAMGVENELEISSWESLEKSWMEESLELDDNDEKSDGEVNGRHGQAGGCGNDATQEVEVDVHGKAISQQVSPLQSQKGSFDSHPSSPYRNASDRLSYNTLTQECERVSKYKFPPHQFYLGSNTARPLPHKYKFKVYAPLVFARIRSLFGVEKQTFLHSICGKFNFYEFASNARSGQFFFYSHDGRYMIKTLTHTESKFLREILPYYYRHLTRCPSTFLTHFYGMYRVSMPNANNQHLHFIIMRSVFHTEKKIDRVWDLKGSKTGRKASKGDGVGKDLDILEEGRRLKFVNPKARGLFLDQLTKDATFLARLGIMDYSLLLGLHNCEEEDDGGNSSVGSSACGNCEAPTTPPSNSGKKEPCRSNTPFRRGVLFRAASAGDTKVGDNGFKALETRGRNRSSPSGNRLNDETMTSSSTLRRSVSAGSASASSTLNAIIESPSSTSISNSKIQRIAMSTSSLVPENSITSRSDMGIDGYGAKLDDGTLAKREIYFCGIIDILQYYNARKMGETVIRKAAGNSGQDISCVDPETYGKRFVKFLSNLVEE